MPRTRLVHRSMTTRRLPAFRPQAESLEGRQLLSAGDLDPTFGNGTGFVLTSQPGSNPSDVLNAVALQPDGKVLVAGHGNGDQGRSFEVVRLTADGTLDSSFGSGGRSLPWTISDGGCTDMALQPDGKIVLVGNITIYTGSGKHAEIQNDIAIARLNADGTLDQAFGQGGKVITGVSTSSSTDSSNKEDSASSVAIQPDGKVLVGGRTYNGTSLGYDSILLRYNVDGSLDDGSANDTTPGDSFGQGGMVVTAWSTGNDNIVDLAIQPDGKIIASGGYTLAGGSVSYYVARYDANGSLDIGFGSAGLITTPFSVGTNLPGGAGHPLALQANGAIVFAGTAVNGSLLDLAVARYTDTGALDTSFGAGTGFVVQDFGGDEYGRSVAIQPDGKIVLVGQRRLGTTDTLVRAIPAGRDSRHRIRQWRPYY